jgi:hypothetical protein
MRLTKIQQQLRELMSDTSELHHCAGWMDGTEYRLWRFVVDSADDGEWGLYKLEPELRTKLKELAERAGGWIIYAEDSARPRDREGNSFVPVQDWLDLFEAWTGPRRP